MTFSVLLVKDDKPRVVGTLWANDESRARDLVPAVCGCDDAEHVKLLRTENREIPFQLTIPAPMQFGC